MTNEMTLTYQTRLILDHEKENVLQECASLLGRVERSLYAEVAKGKSTASCKNDFLKRFGITARQFNACRVSLEGKIAACQAGQERAIETLKEQIGRLNKKIQFLEKKPSKHFTLHQKKRRKIVLLHRLQFHEEDKKQKRVRLCFGGKKLFNAQFHLEKSGFAHHSEWKKTWEKKRESEFFVLGSKDETAGNQTCTAHMQSNGKFRLRLRLPNALKEKYGKYLEIENVVFSHGHEAILAAWNNPSGQALSYRFKKDDKSWKVFVSTALQKIERVSQEGNGTIGIDLNTDHIAIVETDRFGNILTKKSIPWISYGKTNRQLKALTGEICKEIVNLAKIKKKAIVIENLDFQKKKLSISNAKMSRLLSSFAYSLFYSFLMTRAYKHGIEVHRVNPAFTSIIGRVNYATRYGLSIHLAAALCIARRYQKFSESPCCSHGRIPDGKGGHLAFVLPERNRTKHVWHFWGQVRKKLSTAHEARNLARNRSSSPAVPTPATGIPPDCYW